MKALPKLTCLVTVLLMHGMGLAEQETPSTETFGEAEVIAEPIPQDIVQSAISAVAALGNEVVLGRYQTALDRMNPLWKERMAQRMGGMQALEQQLAKVPEEMVRQGISMLSSKPEGAPLVHQVGPQKTRPANSFTQSG